MPSRQRTMYELTKQPTIGQSTLEELLAQLEQTYPMEKETHKRNRGNRNRKIKKRTSSKKIIKSFNQKLLRLNKLEVEATSCFEDAMEDDDLDLPSIDSVAFVNDARRSYNDFLGHMELWMVELTVPRTRQLYISMILFDSPLIISSCIRITQHVLEFCAEKIEELRRFMLRYPDIFSTDEMRRVTRRCVELKALAAAKKHIKVKQVKVGVVRRFKRLYERYFLYESFDYLFHPTNSQEVEATSLLMSTIKGIGAGVYSAKQFYNLGKGHSTDNLIERTLMNWAMSAVSVIKSNRLIDWMLWALQFVNIFHPLADVIVIIWETIQKLWQKLPSLGFGPQQQDLGQIAAEVEPTSDIQEVISKACQGLASNVGTTAAILSVLSVFAGSVLVGSSMPDVNRSLSIAERLIRSGAHVAKTKTGLYAMIQMISDFKPWIETSVSYLLQDKIEDSFSKFILDCDVQDTEEFKKNEVFSYITKLINPEDYHSIRRDRKLQRCLNWSHSVISRVLEMNVSTNKLAPQVVIYLSKLLTELGKVRLGVFRYVDQHETRFVPMWINIVGKAGTRKSTFMMKFANNILCALRKLGKYDIPGENSIFSVNFTDRYLTAYKQEDVVLIDDIFQDAAPLGERSSALDIISWVSNIPHHTNQAAIEDKGIPFTSKIIISTSNVAPSALQRKEIICPEALKRRMMCYEFVLDDKAPYDPMIEANVRIFRLNPLGGVNDRTLVSSARELCAMVLKDFVKHYDLQTRLIANSGADPDCVDYMITSLECEQQVESPFVVEDDSIIANVEATSLIDTIRSRIFSTKKTPLEVHGPNGGQTVNVFDLYYHPEMQAINEKYIGYVSRCVDIGEFAVEIDEFVTLHNQLSDDTASSHLQLQGFISAIGSGLKWIKSRPLWNYLATATAAILAYKFLFSSKRNMQELTPTAIQYDYGKPVTVKPPKARIVVPTSSLSEAYQQDFVVTGTDSNAMDLVLNTLIGKGQVVRLTTSVGENKCGVSVGIRIGGTTILANHHFFANFQPGQRFSIEVPHYFKGVSKVHQAFDPRRFVRLGNQDACLYRCDNSLQNAKVIVHHFSSDAIANKPINGIIASRNPESMYVSNIVAVPNTTPLEYMDPHGVMSYSVLNDYEVVNYAAVSGTSGSLLVALDPYTPRKLLGIQTSRNNKRKTAYFTPITEDQLRQACISIGETLNSTPLDRDLVVDATSVIFDDKCPPNIGMKSLQYIGSIPKRNTISFQSQSKIMPSLVQDEDALVKAPAALSGYDVRLVDEVYGKNLMYKNVEGYDTAEYGALDLNLLDIVEEALSNEYNVNRSVPGISRRPLNDFEMINGIRGKINALDMTTSPGYPWIKQRVDTNLNGKFEWYYETVDPLDGRKLYKMKEFLESALLAREYAAKVGQRIPTIGYTCLKDETRPIARVAHGITRVFICLPMDFNLLIRKYFGMFIATQHAKAGEQASSVGLDPTTDWKKLYYRLLSKGKQWEDFDYKNWDQTLHPEFLFRYAKIVNKWYGDSDDSPNGKVRITLILELAHTYLMIGSKLFLKSGGQDSGCAITAEINCDVHDLLMAYVFLYLLEKRISQLDKGDEYQELIRARDDFLGYYRNNVAIAVYGDDIVKSCTSSVQQWFNGNEIAPVMMDLGMKITPADKNSTVFLVKKPEEVTFLKRSFQPDPNDPTRIIRCPLDFKTIWNIPQWIKKGNDEVEATRVNCEMALREMFMYGKEQFNIARDELNRRIMQFNIAHVGKEIPPLTLSYEILQRSYEEGNLELCFPKGWRELRDEDLEDLF